MTSGNKIFKAFAVLLALTLAASLIAYRQYKAKPSVTQSPSDPTPDEIFGSTKRGDIAGPGDVAFPASQAVEPVPLVPVSGQATQPSPPATQKADPPQFMHGLKAAPVFEIQPPESPDPSPPPKTIPGTTLPAVLPGTK